MASKTVKGLTVEINGDTTKLGKALRDVEKQSRSLSSELSDVQKLLRYDSTSVVALTQKKELLTKAVAACADKLEILRDAERQVQAQFERGEASEEQMRALQREIEATEIKMKDYQKSLNGTFASLSKLGVTTDDVRYAVARMADETDNASEPVQRIGARIKELDERYGTLTGQLRDVNALLKKSPDSVTLLAQKKELLAKAVATATERLEALKYAQQQAKRQFDIGAISDDQFNDVRIAASRAEIELDELSDELRRLGTTGAAHMDDLEDETREAGNAAKESKDGYTVFKNILADICSDVLREFVELMKEAGKYILLTGSDFEQSMSKVEALLGPTEATSEAMADLTALAMDMGAKTKFSAGESADAMAYLAQAGWGTEQIIAGLPGVMNLAATDGIDLAVAAEICSDALNSLGYNADQATTFADVLAVVAAESSTNVEELGYAFQYVGPVAGALGYDMNDLAIALGVMADAGIKGEKAGTSLRSLFTNLSKPTADMSAAMEQYGISLTNSKGEMLPFVDVMAQLRNVFSGLTEEQQAALAATLAGKTGMAGLLAIVNESPEDFYEMMEAIDGSKDAAERMATTMQDNLAGDVEKLGGAFDTLAIKITQKFNEPLRQAVQAVTGFLEGTVSLPDMLSSIGDAIVGLATGFADFLPMLAEMGGQLIQMLIDGITNGLPLLFESVNSIAQTIGQYLAEMAPTFLQFGIDLVMNIAQGLSDWIPNLITIAADIIGSLSTGIQQNTADFISNALTLLDGFADKLAEAIPILIEKGAEFLLNMAKGISQALPDFIARAPEIISKFANLINDNFPTILKKGVEIIWELIKGIIKAIPDLIANIPKIIKAIIDVWEAFNWMSLGKKAIDLLGKGIKGLWGWLKNIGKGTADAIINFLKALPQNLMNLGKNAVQMLGKGIKAYVNFVLDAAKFIWGNIFNFFKTLPDKMLEIGGNLIRGLWSGIKNMMSWLWDKVCDFGGTLIGWFTDLFDINSPSKVFAWMGEMLDRGLAKGILDNIDDPMNAATKLTNSVLGTMDGFDGMSVERSIKNGEMRRVMEVTAMSDNTMLGKLDKIVSAIEHGQVLTIDGKALVGGTAQMYDSRLGQRRALVARGAI